MPDKKAQFQRFDMICEQLNDNKNMERALRNQTDG